ncbi:hypothetical protein DI09_92p30 [Mitosporidium daphniae]|uniref:Uncharacterized protein n=1 Tax=Mitosporidium daphniae TaxID=1485682 RepID=A0A098VM54_9MICR|nr:uncharacterized protein DI09_92p30 [Mitosporidium daphniae]KGG50030.1 hypothetical protein DI09_92p30 [Mitosporidium daphniae]|eukprot:XP_013236466.1 uncharacterized protein DI09_92p30 [Mitosporidium daphniae]
MMAAYKSSMTRVPNRGTPNTTLEVTLREKDVPLLIRSDFLIILAQPHLLASGDIIGWKI